MRECWLRPNRRILSLSLVLSALAVVGGLMLAWFFPAGGQRAWAGWLGLALAGTGLLAAATFFYTLRLPRLAYEDGQLLVYLRSTTPERAPIEMVECFFLGQGPSLLRTPDGTEAETSNIIVRLAERGLEWRDRETNPALGEWRCGYITVRGTWCEPITPELVKRLNQRLAAIHRQQREEFQPAGGKGQPGAASEQGAETA